MKKILFLSIAFLMTFSFLPVNTAFGHGLGGEMRPLSIENKNATLSIDISPSVFDPQNPENFITLKLFDSKTEAIIEHVTFILELKKDGERIFRYMFHDEFGNLNVHVISDDSESIKVEGNQENVLGGWMRGDSKPLTMTGPIFSSGGLYEYKVEVITIDSDTNILDPRIDLEGAISLADTKSFTVMDSQNQPHKVQTVSYFDTLEGFSFEDGQMDFSMPFDWSQDLEQISVVHQEIRIPNTFGEFLSTKYDSYVNGILLPDDAVTIDDYSFDDRTVHIVLNKEWIKQTKDDAVQASDSKMHFHIQTSEKVQFPLEFATPDLRYKAFLSWEPETIKAGQEVTFYVELQEMFSDKTKKTVEYNLEIIQNDSEIFNKQFTGNVNSETPNEYRITFDSQNVGTANMIISDIDGNSLSKGNFIIVIHSPDILLDKDNSVPEIPSWIKNNAGWWANDQIDDETFVQGIEYLVKQNILQISATSSEESSSNEIPSWIKNNAGWWANDQIDDETFVQGIQFLIRQGIVVT
ncbi:peptidase [archaeon]|nr:peptidase [archaeon]